MRRLHFVVALATTALLSLTTFAAASASSPTSSTNSVVQIPVSFQVQNVNRSKVPCASNGGTYTVRGHLVEPTDAAPTSVTLYLHGLSFGEFFYDFQPVPDYNYAAAQARLGNASVVVDRLGYGRSDKLNGFQICVGARADIAHQMVTDLRSGNYSRAGGTAPTFAAVALAGHSYGGQIAQVEAYSFGDIDGLIVLAYSDRVQSALLKQNAAYADQVCASGGQRINGTGPRGYTPFGPPSGAPAALFHSSPPPVENAALPLLSVDPCGDVASFPKAVPVDLANLSRVRVPVLVVGGGADALFPPPAAVDQARLFTGSSDVTQTTLPDTAHALTLEAGHTRLVLLVDHWLREHGLSGTA